MRVTVLALGALVAAIASVANEVTPTIPEPPSTLETIIKPQTTTAVPSPVGGDFAVESDSLPSFHDAIRNLARDGRGFIHVGDDGVVRSFAYNGSVIDCTPLHSYQLFESFAYVGCNGDKLAHLHETFATVSDHDVTDEKQLRNPLDHLKPRELETAESHKKWHAVVDKETATTSPNMLTVVIRRLKRQGWSWDPDMSWCYGQTCTSGSWCSKFGCEDCIGYDRMHDTKVCLGVALNAPRPTMPPQAGMMWGSCSSFPYCKKA